MRQLRAMFHSASWVGLVTLLLAVPYLRAENSTPDAQIAKEAEEIHNAIVGLSDYGVFDWVTFDIQGSTVILGGYASRPELKKSAERVTLKVPGVENVMNDIKVLPLSTFDDQLRTQLYFRIYNYSALARYNPNWGTPLFNSAARMQSGLTYDPPAGPHPIHIIVDNGNVTLLGFVDNEGDRILAGIRAKTTPGVFSVTNDLMVDRGPAAKGGQQKQANP
ncbi:MAG: BON domain-containing protein [Acidobacteriota bacterium]